MSVRSFGPAPAGPARNARSIPTYPSDLEQQLVALAQSGDSKAVALLWEQNWDRLRGYFLRQTGNQDDAEDLASETLLSAVQHLAQFRGWSRIYDQRASFGAYVRGIARHKLSRWIGSRASRRSFSLSEIYESELGVDTEDAFPLDPASGGDPLFELLSQEHRDSACNAMTVVALCSADQFSALLLHYFCRVPHKTIASLTKCRPETVNTRLQEGRKAVLRQFQAICPVKPPAKSRYGPDVNLARFAAGHSHINRADHKAA
ncbi:MAG TPA: RNA polymerase sigma factor [Chthonomonadales bacterium]|nr:RNA polymerase sigma factor [Chthonomonadales bacterium]